MRKLRISNINNLKYSATHGNKKFAHGATELIRTMEAKARRFSDIFIMDAIRKTNCVKMSLVCVEGVSNLGGERLKSFLVLDAIVLLETKELVPINRPKILDYIAKMKIEIHVWR
ncbi:hypothetical protein PHYBLDRAFT_73360 [Phycomyces blakesleeanus NRRL 1555(-)]|uniref:Uncharacterized protein n=1 Tax=Phycomyces blakesleeanus (strain ATCC 8743b / DSM 1359 / FGSC 10004 / NBRC 33097 / NRRL 1555) TaxID=763407 RepID=A0A162U657_PHYB8|nr:hypothetical protein PHYBLDRAFT_73360 [Phycomyces blakesleeanus NRRL 1555(-)]OAD72633.1 hypothetical protein PHYBLDRAFT_73360 [Phycomyces blakesleeanus NRRL 1555(-)]|eukprot:XP_018290673.1 hypothetical protein PHYBLDRAFT_73360 [Phycomyces blakesleeanus NRRL 1555(-)]